MAQTAEITPESIQKGSLPGAGQVSARRRPWWRAKRAIILSTFILLWVFLAYKLLVVGGPNVKKVKIKKPKVIHADRYSEKYKFRPAASPVITETLRDGTILLRGAFRNPHVEHDEL